MVEQKEQRGVGAAQRWAASAEAISSRSVMLMAQWCWPLRRQQAGRRDSALCPNARQGSEQRQNEREQQHEVGNFTQRPDWNIKSTLRAMRRPRGSPCLSYARSSTTAKKPSQGSTPGSVRSAPSTMRPEAWGRLTGTRRQPFAAASTTCSFSSGSSEQVE